MNKSVRNVAVFSLFMVLILLINLTVIQGFREDEYAQNPLNARAFYENKQIDRGQINAAGLVLAESNQDENGFYQRSYPTMPVEFSPILGYLSDQYGAAGLEASFNGVLNGTDSAVVATQWFDELTGKEQRGANLELTVDPVVQKVAYDQLSVPGYEGAAVAIRPSTGEIVALAGTPSYDPNLIVNPETAEETWTALNANPANPLVNQATQDTLPPGSIFKIVTTAAGLNNGYTPDSMLTGAASITLPNTATELTNYAGQPCGSGGQVTLREAFVRSCNTAFVEMAVDFGAEELRAAADAFGIGETYDLGLPTSPGTLGELEDLAAVGQSSIGQRDVTMSALQAAIMAATVANDGTRMEPYLVRDITAPDLSVIRSNDPHEITQAVTPEHAATLQELMLAAEPGDNDRGSKTGTAEHAEGVAPHVWYVAYDESSDVAVGVVVKNGGNQGRGATGAQIAAPIGRAILDAAERG